MNYEKHMKSSIAFFKSMAEKNRAEEETGSDYQDGQSAGAAIAWSVAAEHLEDLLRWEGIGVEGKEDVKLKNENKEEEQ